MNDIWSENVQGGVCLCLSARKGLQCAAPCLETTAAEKAVSAVNAKYDERLRLYREGVKQWDTSVSVTMILRGVKK